MTARPTRRADTKVDSTRGSLLGPDKVRIDRLEIFHDSLGGGAWPFLVRVLTCLVDSDNERDHNLLNRNDQLGFACWSAFFLERLRLFKIGEVCGDNRSMMPLDVQGCTRATMVIATSLFASLKRVANLAKVIVLGIVVWN